MECLVQRIAEMFLGDGFSEVRVCSIIHFPSVQVLSVTPKGVMAGRPHWAPESVLPCACCSVVAAVSPDAIISQPGARVWAYVRRDIWPTIRCAALFWRLFGSQTTSVDLFCTVLHKSQLVCLLCIYVLFLQHIIGLYVIQIFCNKKLLLFL